MKSKLHPFERIVERSLDQHGLLAGGDSAIVAVSAGPDSTALLLALSVLAPSRDANLSAFHVDHGIRGEESREDCRAAEALARGLSLAFGFVRLRPHQSREVSEEELRRRRFEAFKAEAKRRKTRDIFLGHHAGDLAETTLMRLMRGAGLEGLAAFGAVEEWEGLRLVRPMIESCRAEALAYLNDRNTPYRIDSSNKDQRYLRNAVRATIIPMMEDLANPLVRESLARTARLLKRDADFMAGMTREISQSRVRFCGDHGAAVGIDGWEAVHEALRTRALREVCRRITGNGPPPYERHLFDLDRLACRGRTGSYQTGWNGLAAYRDADDLRLVRMETGGRPGRSEIFAALRAQTLCDSGWVAPIAKPLLVLGDAMVRERNPVIVLSKGKGRVGAASWRLEKLQGEKGRAPSTAPKDNVCAIDFRREGSEKLTLMPAPLDSVLAVSKGRKPKTAAARLASRRNPPPLFWREALPALASGEEIVWIAGLGPQNAAGLSNEETAILWRLTVES